MGTNQLTTTLDPVSNLLTKRNEDHIKDCNSAYAYPADSENMRIYIQCSLMYTRRQCRIQTLRQSLRHNQFLWNFLELHVGLKRLPQQISSINFRLSVLRDVTRAYLEQLLQECNAIRPFMNIIKPIQAFLHLLDIFFVFRIRTIVVLACCVPRRSQFNTQPTYRIDETDTHLFCYPWNRSNSMGLD